MAEYRFVVRGEGLVSAIEEGFFCTSYFTDLLDRTPEPLLPPDALQQLNNFLEDPSPPDRWNKTRKQEGLAFAALVQASQRDALVPEAKDLLCKYLSGKSLRKRGRPSKKFRALRDLPLIAKVIKDHVEVCLREGKPLIIPKLGEVFEDGEWRSLPVSERAMLIAHKALQDRGYDPPSVRTLRNCLPPRSTLGIFS